ncbi:dTMP kinase [Xanthobacter sp. DSM 24535]|uniref:dTMP kinase n=1 Tax=Roseixanthobacter psychrophilus TaxID=3119917 RepID=UPI00372A665C
MTAARGRFITLEGGEGTGKSTQARLLAAALEKRGIAVRITREPGGSPLAEQVREVLLSGAAQPLGPQGEAALFAAARADHVRGVIQPALDAGTWVICDRFTDSTRVYQGAVGKADPRLLRALDRVSVGTTVPDLTLVLDVPPQIGLARAAARGKGAAADRFEREGADYHAAVRDAFLALARAEPERCVIIDAQGDVERVAALVLDAVSARLKLPAESTAA